MGPHQTLRFVEDARAAPAPHTNHVAIYLTRYQETYRRMKDLRNVMEAHRNEQFRFCRILNLDSGKPMLELEHEMRSLYHGDFARPLVNRGPVFNRKGAVVGAS